MSGIEGLLTNPIAVKVHDEKNNKKTVALMFSIPYKYKKEKEIGLIILGNISKLVIDRIEQDLAAGIAIGHFQILCEIQKAKAKKDPESLYIKSFSYQEYEYAYKEVIEYGSGIGIAMYQQKYLRKAIKEITRVKDIIWAEKSKNKLVKVKEEDYNGSPVISYWDKEAEENWVIPEEAINIWQHIRYFSGENIEELTTQLYGARIKEDKKTIKKIGSLIEKYIKEG
ncbi:MAG: hypothetical protein GF308_21750 [Candidatus Heimdallarchaeota archaeon]|nr:hypothetical protein [Candidatus Heimdallarchaeota archaeon]